MRPHNKNDDPEVLERFNRIYAQQFQDMHKHFIKVDPYYKHTLWYLMLLPPIVIVSMALIFKVYMHWYYGIIISYSLLFLFHAHRVRKKALLMYEQNHLANIAMQEIIKFIKTGES